MTVVVRLFKYHVFLRLVIKQANYLDGKIPLAHAWSTHLSQVIKSQNKIIYTVVNILIIYVH
jgi:hypothetical protein